VTGTTAHQEKGSSVKRSALVVTSLSSFLTPLALATVNVALPSIGREFAVDALSLGWIATSYILTAAMFLIPFGKIADIWGRKKVFLWGTFVFSAASLLLGFSSSAGMLIGLRALQGIGGAMLFGTGIAILSSVFPVGERGRVLGINVASVYLGLSCGPFVGGILTQHLGWRSIFFINVPVGLFIVVLCLKTLKEEWAEARGQPFDLLGSCIYSTMIFALMGGLVYLPGLAGISLCLAGVLAMVFFVFWERKTPDPILDMALFSKNRVFTLSNIAALINYSATFAVGFLLSFYLQHIRALTPQATGVLLIAQPIVQAVFSPLAGRLSDRVEPRIVASTGMGLTALGLFFLSFLRADTPFWFIVGSLALLGFGFALFSSPNTNAIMSSVVSRFYGVASSMLATMRLLGQMLSMAIAMIIFTIYFGGAQIQPALYPLLLAATKVAFTLFGLLCLAGIFASLTRGNLR
jgi:EmrB/QacA subfamily drug resistance transporter